MGAKMGKIMLQQVEEPSWSGTRHLRDRKSEPAEKSIKSQFRSGEAMANGSAAADEIWELMREFRLDLRASQEETAALRKEATEHREEEAKRREEEAKRREEEAKRREEEAKRREEEAAARRKEEAERQRKFDKGMDELRAAQKETERVVREVAEEQRKTDRQQQETDRQLKETDRQLKETDRQLKATDSRFNTQWGRLVESLVEGSLVPLLRARGIEVRQTSRRVEVEFRTPGGERKQKEFDILVVNGDEAVAVEVKTTLTPGMVKYFLSAMEDFKRYFPDYGHKRVYGAVAYLRSESEAAKYAERQGLFVVRATGDSASIVNAEWFVPKAFPSR